MALQVWLPLNGNLNNQGLSNITVTNSGATVDNNGKIGKCYNFDGSSKITNTLPTSINNNIGTLACWVKFNSFPSSGNSWMSLIHLGTLGGFANCRLGMYMESNNGINISIDGSSTGANLYTHSLTTSTWYHLCTTYDGTTVKLYINGEQVMSKTASKGSYTTAASNLFVGGTSAYYLNGRMNDARYYDRALAPKEVEVLSRGLVCHYPLNGSGRGGDNLLKNTGDLTLWTKESGITTTWDSEKNLYKIVDSTHTSSRWGIYQDINVEANTSYTITSTLNGDNCAVAFGFYDSSTSFPGNLITVTDSTTKRLSYTVTSGASSTKARVYLNINCANSSTKTAWFGLPKVEKGSVSTPWIPNPADTAYTAMGYNSTTEYDVSGYGYNMTKTGTITYTTDSIRYSVASHFINGSYILATKNCPDYLPTDGITVNLWVKPTTWANPISCTESGGWNFEGSTIQFVCYISGVGYKAAVSGVTGASLQDGKWHMLTGTYDRIAQEVKIYVDGILKTTTATGSSNNIGYASNRLVISGEAGGGTPASSAFVGEESDVRIYATALSAVQVAELYNTAVSVANNGALMGYELMEG